MRGGRAGYGPVEVLHGIDLDVAQPASSPASSDPTAPARPRCSRCSPAPIALRGGTLLWEGAPFAQLRTEQRARLGLLAVPEARGVFPHLSVRDNLAVFAAGRSLAPGYDAFPVLRERGRQAAGTLSGGEQRMLALSRALVSASPLRHRRRTFSRPRARAHR